MSFADGSPLRLSTLRTDPGSGDVRSAQLYNPMFFLFYALASFCADPLKMKTRNIYSWIIEFSVNPPPQGKRTDSGYASVPAEEDEPTMESGEELSEFMHPEGGHAAVLDLQASPFEFRVLEVALDSVCSRLDVAVSALEKEGRPAVDALTQRVSSHSLETVKRVKGDINRLVGRVTSVRDEIQRFLDDDRLESPPVSLSPEHGNAWWWPVPRSKHASRPSPAATCAICT